MTSLITIDGQTVPAPAGTTVLEAARSAGINIPTLCYHPALPPDGSCRVCLVEVAGQSGLHPACVLPATAGQEVRTETEVIRTTRRDLLQLLLAEYRPGRGRAENELLALASRYGVSPPPELPPTSFPLDDSNPFIRVDRDACMRGRTGVPADDIRRAARLLWEHRPGALLFAMGITQHTVGTANAFACTNLQLLLGNLGVPGAGINPLRGQNNVQGSCDVGALPDVLPGYQAVTDAGARRRFGDAWGVEPPARPGLTVTELLDGTLSRHIHGLYILGENVAMTDPDLNHVHQCLAACEFLVVQELFMSETARFAHVVLPAAASAEKAGTFTNTERRIQVFAPVVPPPGEARPDWWVIAEIGKRVHRDGTKGALFAGWDHASPADVMKEIAALTPIYGGVSYARLGPQGLQWPCPTPDHAGTAILHVGRTLRGPARFTPVSHQPPAEVPDKEYPFALTTGRVLEHYHSGTMTRRVAALDWLVPEAVVEIHPDDASRFAMSEGARIRVRSRRGEIVARARLTEGITRGTLFIPFHFAEAAANTLTHAVLDPIAKIPEYKVCAVAIESLPETLDSPRQNAAHLSSRDRRRRGRMAVNDGIGGAYHL